jgi:hypothetical protein
LTHLDEESGDGNGGRAQMTDEHTDVVAPGLTMVEIDAEKIAQIIFDV